jgi:hypothetical protein
MGFENVEKLAAYLDAGPAKDACQWLHEHSGDEIVEEYGRCSTPAPVGDRAPAAPQPPKTERDPKSIPRIRCACSLRVWRTTS